MPQPSDRIDGWKAIGAHFGRDRTTAIRWAKERGLPVHALPGGKTRTVYALRSELDAWRAGSAAVEPPAPLPSPAKPAPLPLITLRRARRRALVIGAALFALIVVGLLALRPLAATTNHAPALPADPRLARRYIDARNELAQRDAPGLAHAIAELRAIVAADPDFAPANASLADGYLLAREFGAMDDTTAFPQAGAAARRALRVDGGLASAHRALALIAYWWDHDPAAAAAGFRRALALDGNDALTHLWYANVLADNGDAASAAREFAAAKLHEPGLPSIGIDEAWAIWSAGDDARAQAMLGDLARRSPMLASPHDCLSMVALARGDLRGYARELTIRASLRGERALTDYARAIQAAVARADADTLSMLMTARAQTLQAGTPHQDQPLAAFFQSALGRRAALIEILRSAEQRREQWPGAGYRLHIERRWRDDAEIVRLLRGRAPRPLV